MGRKRIGLICTALLSACLLAGCSSALKEGTEALGAGDYEKALTDFQEAASDEDRETAAEGYRGLGIVYYESGDYGQALEAFENALDNGAEQTVQLYNLMGAAAMQEQNYEKALEYFQAGLELAETQSGEDSADAGMIQEMEYNEIVCYEQTADWENAKQKITEYTEKYPDDENAKKEAEFHETR